MKKLASLAILLLSCQSTLAFATSVKAEFIVRAPQHFQTVNKIYLNGSIPALGQWKSDAIPMQRRGQYFYARVTLPSQTYFEYKYTLGTWERAELDAYGGSFQNRKGLCQRDCRFTDEIQNFKVRPVHKKPISTSRNVTFLHERYSTFFKNFRSVAVYLPPGYSSRSPQRYPVLYALDGNNLFDRRVASFGMEWSVDETLDQLISQGKIQPVIVVGIYSTKRRAEEYLHGADSFYKRKGYADQYMKFLMTKIKPDIDRRFRTKSDRSNTYLMGSSFGGFFGLYASWNYAQYFRGVIAMSPAFWWNNKWLIKMMSQKPQLAPEKIWMDMGGKEGQGNEPPNFRTGVLQMKEAYRNAVNAGLIPERQIKAVVDDNGKHNELSWAKRFPYALKFILEK